MKKKPTEQIKESYLEATPENIVKSLEDVKELCIKCAEERRAKNLSQSRVANVGRMLNEHIKALRPIVDESGD